MIRTIAEINRIQTECEKKRDYYEDSYQQTGRGSRKTIEKYDDFVSLCILARQALSEDCARCGRTHRNIADVIARYEMVKRTGLEKTVSIYNFISDLRGLDI